MHTPSAFSEDLIASACQGDVEAFDEVIRRFTPSWNRRLRELGVPLDDVEDLLAELYQAIITTSHQIKHPHAFKAFYDQRILWMVNDYRKKMQRQPISLEALIAASGAAGMDDEKMACLEDTRVLRPEEALFQKEESQQIWQALSSLPEGQSEALFLYAVDGMSYDAVAQHLGIPVGTVRSRLANGRKKMQRTLDL